MNTQQFIHHSMAMAKSNGRSDVGIVDMYQGFLMYDDQNRYLVGNIYGQNLGIMMPDLFWCQFVGRPEHLPEPDLGKMMTDALDARLQTEIEGFNDRFADMPDAAQAKAYLVETASDMYDTSKPTWTHFTRAVIRLGLMDLKAAKPEDPLNAADAQTYFKDTYAHPLAWLDRLGQAGQFPENASIWRFVTSLDPEFDYGLRARCNGIPAQWSEQTRDLLPAPEFSRMLYLGAIVAQALKQDTIYLPHIFTGTAPNSQRISQELLLMGQEPLLVQGRVNDWIAALQPEPPAPASESWPLSISRMPSFMSWDKNAHPTPALDPVARKKLNDWWPKNNELMHKNPDMGVSKAVQWLLHEAAEPEDITLDDPEDNVPSYVRRTLHRGDTKELLRQIEFPDFLYAVWAKLSEKEDLSKIQRTELDALMPASPQANKDSGAMVAVKPTAKPNSKGYKISDSDFKKALEEFTTDITDNIKAEEMPVVTGREGEIERVVERLNSRRYRSVIVTGEPGVGKSTLVLAYAQRVATGQVPERQKNVRVLELNAEAIMAETSLRGQAEKNFKILFQGIMERNRSGEDHIVLSIPEAHTIKGMGASMDDSTGLEQRLKKWMTNRHLPLILDLDTDSYNRTFARDAAFVRRCEVIDLKDIDKKHALEALKQESLKAANDYGVTITDSQIGTIYSLTAQHLPRLSRLDTTMGILDTVMNHANMQGRDSVDTGDILEAVAQKANLPADFLKKDQRQIVLLLGDNLRREVVGQDDAIHELSDAMLVSKAGLNEPNKPLGSFLFIGPTGVGKTELSRQMAAYLMGSEERLIRLDMSEYMEQHSVSKIIGAPPGYVGYGEVKGLTDKVGKQPYAVVLFDEIEKAHPAVHNLFLQILDDGKLTDSTGKVIDFSKTVIIATSNVGAKIAQEEAKKGHIGFDDGADVVVDQGKIMLREAEKYFSPELRNRFDGIVTFNSLKKENMPPIVDRQMRALNQRLHDEWGVTIELSDQAKEQLIKVGFDADYGARPLKRAMNKQISVPLGRALLAQTFDYNPDEVLVVTGIGKDFGLEHQKTTLDNLLIRKPTTGTPILPPASNNNSRPTYGGGMRA